MSGHKLDDQELAALRASVVSVRCGRSLPLMHLSELDEVFTQRRHRAPIVLCGADVADPDHHHDDADDCPGCADCLCYCPDCVRSAVRWAEQRNGIDPNAEVRRSATHSGATAPSPFAEGDTSTRRGPPSHVCSPPLDTNVLRLRFGPALQPATLSLVTGTSPPGW